MLLILSLRQESGAPGVLRPIALLFLLLFFPAVLTAETPVTDGSWAVEQWDSSQGLRPGGPQDIIAGVAQSPDGTLWIASLRSVWSFDGMRFEKLQLPPHIDARISRIFDLEIGAAGELWIATSGAGALRVEQNLVSIFAGEQGMGSDIVLAVFEDSRGRVWIASERGGLHSLDKDQLRSWSTERGLEGITLTSFMEDSRGRLLAGSWGNGVFLLEHNAFRPFAPTLLAGRTITSMVEDSDGGFWFGTGSGVVHYDASSGAQDSTQISVEHGLSHPVVYDLQIARRDELWVATGAGLNRIDNATETASARHIEILFADTWVKSLLVDREHSLWAGTFGDGLKHIRKGGLHLFGRSDGMPSDTIQCIYEDDGGNLWVGTQRGVLRFANGDLDSENMEIFLDNTEIETVGAGRDGMVWVGTPSSGLVRLELGNGRVPRPFPLSSKDFPTASVTVLHRDSRNWLWLGSHGALGRLVEGELQTLGAEHGYHGQPVQCFHEDSSGVLRIGTGTGLMRFDPQQDRLVPVELPGVAPPVMVSWIHEDRQGALWLATVGDGLLRLADGELAQLGESTGLRSNRLYQLFEDAHGYFWFTSANGVFRARWEELRDAADSSESPNFVHCRSVGQQGVLPHNHWSNPHRRTSTMTRDGRLLIGTVEGIAVITPAELELDKQPPQVLIKEVLRNGRPVELQALSQVFYGRSDMDFAFTAPSFISPSDLVFTVQLVGRDDDERMIHPGEERTVRYDNLGPGRYQLRVLAANSDGVWNKTGAAFDFQIRPYLHETFAFRTGVVVVALFAAIGLVYSATLIARWRRQRNRYRSSTLTRPKAEQSITRLRALMEHEELYRDQSLSLETLAGLLGILPKHLSQIVNEHLQLSFPDFVNGYRVEEAKRLLREDPERKVLAIAHEVGFNTNDAFYRAFKKRTGTTPSSYRKNHES